MGGSGVGVLRNSGTHQSGDIVLLISAKCTVLESRPTAHRRVSPWASPSMP